MGRTSRRKCRGFATGVGQRSASGGGRSRNNLRGCVRVTRGLRLDMANNPKKVKDPTEVALSAIQEALNISDVAAENSRGSARGDVAAGKGGATANLKEGGVATRARGGPARFEPSGEPGPAPPPRD